ncbi:MAG TPA: DUF4833 domain-containing protein [Polyangiaceae bacterium]|jgi:hypothetical protein|nr:DUF4833 domain-containing protein [Polyangiaceae bacterium]
MSQRSTRIATRFLSAILPGGIVAAGLAVAATAAAEPVTELRAEIPDALVITKSSNKNQVNYAVEVDAACAPSGPSPVRAYWRMLEHGAAATEPLRDDEARAFGIEHQVVHPGAGPQAIEVVLRGLPARALTIHTWRSPAGTCASSVNMTIAGVPARVANVHVQQTLFGIAYVLLTGYSPTGAVLRERVAP